MNSKKGGRGEENATTDRKCTKNEYYSINKKSHSLEDTIQRKISMRALYLPIIKNKTKPSRNERRTNG